MNLDSKTRLATIQSIEHPNKHTFEPAQKRIQALMEKDSYPRFLRSDTYPGTHRRTQGQRDLVPCCPLVAGDGTIMYIVLILYVAMC